MLTASDAPADLVSSADLHLDLTGVLFAIWGGLTMVIGTSTLALGIAAVAIITSAAHMTNGIAAGFTAAAFTTLALLAIVWGAIHVATGVLLRRYHPWSRHAALMLATIDLVLLPYGTALGAYGLWALLREDTRLLFAARSALRGDA